ncbi:MAG: chemotaxis protein CheW [Desulfobacula sp.]|uniref:chemotaxis protein CheW n=1 Tax=Desulfobacula sp. TaxID=2593537 RepID=UPI0025BB7D3B|nr:chemotaxis protein CheW [Desulfobacula sp.]MCD4719269.1 chemotaxis protein CheW [Desulfobacula sp.]
MAETTIATSSEDLEFATFYVGGALCGINILNIQEINKHFEITKVPQASDYIEGILNLRGRIVTIIDLGKKLGLDPVNKDKDNRNIIVNSEDEHIGLLVDGISDVVIAKKEDIEPAPSNIGGVKGKLFQGVLKTEKQLIGILDIDEVLKE